MQNLLNNVQMHLAAEFTAIREGKSIRSIIERAASSFADKLEQYVPEDMPVAVLCGLGNNGATGLAIARLLHVAGYKHVSVYLIRFSAPSNPAYRLNLKALKSAGLPVRLISTPEAADSIKEPILIDAILGTGLNRPLSGPYAAFVQAVNNLRRTVYAVDIPTGFPAEGTIAEDLIALQANRVFCFQLPKVNFFFLERINWIQHFDTLDIDLDAQFIQSQECRFKLITIKNIIQERPDFSHKGTFGHALIVAGSEATMGAALLAAKACLCGGAGLTTACIPQSGLTALNTSLPEVMYLPQDPDCIRAAAAKYNVIAVGPGLGTSPAAEVLLTTLVHLNSGLVVDADALNICAKSKKLLDALPTGSILTPHVKEFDRLFGKHAGWWLRVETARKFAQERGWVIVLKNQYSFVALPDGQVLINPTGNPAIASGGMGDVLTGIIASFCAQGYSPENATLLACFLHGQTADILALKQATVSASQVAVGLPFVLKDICAGTYSK